MTRIRIAAAAAVAAAATSILALSTAGPARAAAARKPTATVGPGFTISLVDARGKRVTRLETGRYVVTVRDRSPIHNFALRGPGLVGRESSIPGTSTARWTLVLRKGTYTYVCDPHPETMSASFVVG